MRLFVGAAAIALLMLSGCGGDGSTAPPPISGTPGPSPTPTPTPTPVPPPTSSDPVLASLLSIAQWREAFAPSASYATRSLVEYNGALYFAYADHAPHAVTPDADAAHFERLDLIPRQRLLLSDDFADRPGALGGRQVGPVNWVVSGQAYQSAVTDAACGCATADGNAYFLLLDIPGRISEFSTDYFRKGAAGEPATATTAFSPNNFPGGDGLVMWHANWTTGGVGDILIWKDGKASLDPQNRFSYISGLKLASGRQFRLTVRPRGSFAFGYVDNALAFITIATDNRLAAEARAVYIQNHEAGLGSEETRYVELHVAD